MVIACSSPHRRDALEVRHVRGRAAALAVRKQQGRAACGSRTRALEVAPGRRARRAPLSAWRSGAGRCNWAASALTPRSPSTTPTPAPTQACHWAIDELKATVPIWKKEFFEGGEVGRQLAAARQRARGAAKAAATSSAQEGSPLMAGLRQPHRAGHWEGRGRSSHVPDVPLPAVLTPAPPAPGTCIPPCRTTNRCRSGRRMRSGGQSSGGRGTKQSSGGRGGSRQRGDKPKAAPEAHAWLPAGTTPPACLLGSMCRTLLRARIPFCCLLPRVPDVTLV